MRTFRNTMRTALRDMFESMGQTGSTETIKEMLENGKVKPEDFSIKEIHEACTEYQDKQEAVSSDMFPIITGEIINARTLDAYAYSTVVSDQLVETIPGKMADGETLAGFTSGEGPDDVVEGSSYNDSSMEEDYVKSVPPVKQGRIISITEEMIFHDQTNKVLEAARNIGEQLGQEKEKNIVQGAQDLGKWAGRIYRPSGVDTALFSGTPGLGNLVTSCPFGEAGLELALRAMDAMTDHTGSFISFPTEGMIGLFPTTLFVTSNQMVNSTLNPEQANNAVNTWKGLFKPLRSPWVTAASESTWFIGLPKRALKWIELWPVQTFSRSGQQTDAGFIRDIQYQFKVRHRGMLTSSRPKYWLKCTA